MIQTMPGTEDLLYLLELAAFDIHVESKTAFLKMQQVGRQLRH
jgi:hypothetical protein